MRTGILLTIFTIVFSTISSQNLYSEIANSEDHTLFLELLEFAGLDTLLLTDDYYSVFAPDNEAFEYHYDSTTLDSLKINDPEFLESLLLNHFVSDTVIIEFVSDWYLPLRGSHFFSFVDAAANVTLHSISAPIFEPHILLSEPHYSDDLYQDLDNGRLFGLKQNVINPDCRSIDEWYEVINGPLVNILVQSNWIDTLLNITTPITFLCPGSNEIYEYIEENGGYSNTPFIDSLIRRHIINEYLPLQDVEDETIVKNLLGEDLLFTKQNSQYYFGNSNEIVSFYDYKKLATFVLDSFIVESNVVTTTTSIDLEPLKVFPNPASDVVTVSNPTSSNRSLINIYTIDGDLVLKGEYFGSKFDVDISDLKSGLYIIEYQNDINLKRTKLLVF